MRRSIVLIVAMSSALPALAQAPRPPRDVIETPREGETFAPPPAPRPGTIQTAPLPAPGSTLSNPQPIRPLPPIMAPPLPRAARTPATPQPAPATPADETVVQMPEQKIANPTATFTGLDKITGRTLTFEVAINETVQYGALQVTPRVCYTRPPTETQNTTAFVEVDEITLEAKIRRIYAGWMFAASPGLHAVEHAIYDVWLIDCKATPPVIGPATDRR
jgi:hypothetical protein